MNNEFYGMEKLSLVDFENKIVCTLFTGGCNFRCPFCHNSSLVLNASDFSTIKDTDIYQYLEKRKNILDGVCITGGEPTLLDNLEEKLVEIKKMGYIIKLDTNGSDFPKLKSLVENKLIDYVAMDIKNCFDSYGLTIGYKNLKKDSSIMKNVINSIEYLKKDVIDYEFRTTLVEEFHKEEDIKNMGVELMGCKRLFLQKFVVSDNCIDNTLHEVVKEKALDYKCLLSKYIKDVNLRGY